MLFKQVHIWPIQSAKAIEVIQIKVLAGRGTEEEPSQLITHYFDKDGNWLAMNPQLIRFPVEEEDADNRLRQE